MKRILFILICLTAASCKNADEISKEEKKLKAELDQKFQRKLPQSIIDVFSNILIENDTLNASQKIKVKGKICAINFEDDSNNIKLNHDLNIELISKGYDVSYSIKDIDFLIFTNPIKTQVGEYVDENGKKTNRDAYVTSDNLYVYDVKTQKLYWILQHEGNKPKEMINAKRESGNDKMRAWDFVNYLQKENVLYKVSEDKIAELYDLHLSYPKNYIEFLTDNNFLGIDN